MTPPPRIDRPLRERIAKWVRRYLDLMAADGFNLSLAELEDRADLGKGYGSRVVDGERIGLDTFVALAHLIGPVVQANAHTMLFEDPRPNAADGRWVRQKSGRS